MHLMRSYDDDKLVSLSAGRIREAAKTCPDAERILKILAPEAFAVNEGLVRIPEGVATITFKPKDDEPEHARIGRREGGNLKGFGFYLHPTSDRWEIRKDSDGYRILVLKQERP